MPDERAAVIDTFGRRDVRMEKLPEELMTMRFGGATVAENLQRAIESGALVEAEDGSISLGKTEPGDNWAVVPHQRPMECSFLIGFMFEIAYARSAVPYGCQTCYKVKVVPRSLRELVAAWGIGKQIDCWSKWGADLDNRYSQNIYAGYFYTSGLDMARAVFRVVREAIDNDPKLGAGVTMSIKRGCSDYEKFVGPSDKFEFAPELAELEAHLRSRYRVKKRVGLRPVQLARWIDVAFRIGDDTYLDFTNGQRLHPKMVSYDPIGP
jgi:hypothetical protein